MINRPRFCDLYVMPRLTKKAHDAYDVPNASGLCDGCAEWFALLSVHYEYGTMLSVECTAVRLKTHRPAFRKGKTLIPDTLRNIENCVSSTKTK